VGNYSVTLEQVAGTCAFAITPGTQILSATANSGSVNVGATSGCQWRAISEASWLTINSGANGSGNGIVRFNATANTGSSSRTGRVRIAGESLTITQLGINPVATVSAASFSATAMASESVAASFGSGLATTTQAAETIPLPIELAGTRVTVKDSANAERLASLFFASPGQVNFLIPAGTANGAAMVTIVSGDGRISTGTIQISTVAPALFSANSNGQDVALGVVLRVAADGTQSYEPIARFDSTLNRYVAVPIDFGAAGDRIYLSLFATGVRRLTSLPALTVQIGGVATQVVYAGAQGNLVGVDQINLLLDRSLAGKGEVNIVATANGVSANVVKVSFR
ncbi:MAG: BACON domain-containing carbohydrate-binding protein, partial [Acidobacteriota bacterium]